MLLNAVQPWKWMKLIHHDRLARRYGILPLTAARRLVARGYGYLLQQPEEKQ